MVNDLVNVVNTKNVHLDEVLDEVQRVERVWFENFLIQGLKVGMRLKMANLTITSYTLGFSFSFYFSLIFFEPSGVVLCSYVLIEFRLVFHHFKPRIRV
jgi:hypothetical protein